MTQPVLLVLDGLFHPPLTARLGLERYLRGLVGYDFHTVRSLETLAQMKAARLDPSIYRALVLYYHHRRISPAALDAFQNYVRAGGGVLALHSASASFKQSPGYFDVLGGRFDTHGPVQQFTLRPAEGDDLFAGVPAFCIYDELYRHTFPIGESAVNVHFYAETGGPNTGGAEREPFVWSRRYGAGRVLYLAAGHRAEALRDPNILEIVRRGLAWVCGEGYT